MSDRAWYREPETLTRWTSELAFGACLALPLALLHARAVAEMLVGLVDCLFLVDAIRARRGAWLRHPFTMAAAAWWAWLAICSVLGTGGMVLGLVAFRLPLFALAVGTWVFAGPGAAGARRRHMLWIALAVAAGWIALQCWEQYLTGSNLFGQPRWEDGALTGPFHKPRAGPEYILLLFPVLIPLLARLASSPGGRARSVALASFAALTMVLIGQRMPTLLMVLGFLASGLLLPRLRVAVAVAALAGLALAAASPWLAPLSFAKLVQQTGPQIAHFAKSDYGLIFLRALTVAQLHPWLGLGFDGFRRGCHDFWAMHGIAWLGLPDDNFNGGPSACNLHPHNYYLEALDDAGVPGLVLFCAMVAAALATLARGLGRRAPPLRTGLFVGALVALWPLASTSAFTSMPNAGWVFLILGLGFAASAAVGTPADAPRLSHESAAGTRVKMSEETTTDHGFIRAWAEAREGRPALLESHDSEAGQPLLRFDFGAPEPGMCEIAWDEFFTIFETSALALEYRDAEGMASRSYRLVPRQGGATAGAERASADTAKH